MVLMSNLKHRMLLLFATGAAAFALLVTPSAVQATQDTDNMRPVAQCYPGVTPGNPYAPSCTLPGNPNKIRGSAPDPNAIIACRGFSGCLSWYVNGP